MSQESNLPAKPSVKVRGWVDPFHPQATAFGCVMAGTTIADAISKACKVARARKRYMRRGLVYLGRKTPQGDYKWTRIPQSAWNKVRLKPNDSLTFRLLPEGGGGGGSKNPFRTILNIVVMAVAVVAAAFTAGASLWATMPGFLGATVGGFTVAGLAAGAIAGGLVLTMGQMLVDAIAPIKQQSLSGPTAADQDDVYSLSASSNSVDKWGRVPILFGKGRIAPKKAAAPYTELNGDDMYLHELFIWGECGTGDIKISDLRIGETSVTDYSDIDIETWKFDPKTPSYSKLYPTGISQEEFSVKLTNEAGFITRTSKANAISVSVDIQFQTLTAFNDRGDAVNTSVQFEIDYRRQGDTDWVHFSSPSVSAKSTSPIRRTYTIQSLDGESAYDIRIKRVTADHTSSTKIQDDSFWTAIRTHTQSKPFDINYSAVFTAIRVKATDQLNGALQNLTGEYQAIMKSYNQDTKEWVYEETRDLIPAIRYALQECSARPQPDSVIDWDNIIETDAYWKSIGWKYDKVLDNQTSVLNLIQDICATGLASPTFIDGKWAVIVDKPRDEVVMGITSANSWGWSVDRVTSELPHIIQCDFINEATWEADMREVEVDGSYKTEGRAPIVEKITFDGVTIPDNIYKQASFHYADAKTQVRTISMTMWDESLIATRGDLVSLSQPYLIPKDLEAGRIKSVVYGDNGYAVSIKTDIANTINQETGLGIKIYLDDGSVAHAKIAVNTTGQDSTQTLVFAEAITANIKRGNKYVLGYYSEKDTLAIIKSMKFNADLSCQLTCIDYIEDKYKIFDPDFVVPPFVSTISKPIYANNSLFSAPIVQQIVTDEGAIIRVGNTFKNRAIIYFGIPSPFDSRARSIRCSYRIHDTLQDGETVIPGKWVVFADIPVTETIAYCNDVEKGQFYDFRFQYVSREGKTSKWTTVQNIKIIGKTSLPPTAESLSLEAFGASGLRSYWPATDVLGFDHYKIILKGEGFTTWTGVTNDLELITPIWKWTGTITGELYLVDILGLESAEPAIATYDIVVPGTPVITSSILANTFVLSWQDCKTTWPIKYYKVEDTYTGETFNVADEWTSIEARLADAVYKFMVYAVDVFDNSGLVGEGNIYIPGLEAPTASARIEGDMINISWVKNYTPFDVDYYEIQTVHSEPVAQVKGNTYSVPVVGDGIKEYRVRAVDIAGNVSPWAECNTNVTPPLTPFDFKVAIVGDHLELTWKDPYVTRPTDTSLPILSYDVIRQWTTTREDGIEETHEEDYGTYDALALSVPAVTSGSHTFMVRAKDTGGNTGAFATAEIKIDVPNRVTFYNCSAVDNNVMLYWQEPKITSFPIQAYILYNVDTDGYISELGRTDSLFSAQIENAAGQYTYGVRAMDVAGNIGAISVITMTVASSPDFIVYHDYDSLFNGTRESIALSGDGYMFGPVIEDESWDENIVRVSGLTGIPADDVKWQDKVDNNYNYFMSPFTEATATYTETIDVGVEVPSTKITITPTIIVMEGDPTMVCKIEVSSDGDFWREMTDNAFAVYATSFRYVRVTLSWTGGMYRIDNINFKLDVKRINDAGRAHSSKDDNGEGWVSMEETPMLTGTWVPFNVFFTDIESLPRPNIINDTNGYTAYTVFEDTVYPTGFRVFVLDKDGNRVSADVDWSAFGV